MKPQLKLAALALLSAFSLQPSALLAQGSLTPPGAPAPTMKTLQQIEPRTPISASTTITNPGSYYFTTNVIGRITIAADNVSLDLMGFTIYSSSGLPCIEVSGTRANLWIGNGSVRGADDYGVAAGSAGNVTIQNIRATGNSNYGIRTGVNALILGCQSVSNYFGGFLTGNAGTIKDSAATGNGVFGITVGEGCSVLHCNASYNGSNGITSGNGTTISQCTASRNGSIGINASYGCTVSDCTAYYSHGVGINADQGSLISGCSVYVGDADGIVVTYGCQVLNNTCDLNGTGSANAGVRCLGNRNRIEGNHAYNNINKGIDCGAVTPNSIFKNSASGNSGGNYVNTAGNDVGPIGTAAASTSPWANISF